MNNKLLSDSWKNSNVFHKQLDLNLIEFSSLSNYPPHWKSFINFVNVVKPKSILDIGCGCGSYYELCKRHFGNLKYVGFDYSESAISLAKEHWKYNEFYVKDLFSLLKEDVSFYDIVHLGALLDVLPNGDEALLKVLSLDIKNIIIGRMEVTNLKSYFKAYKAYEEIETCQFYHNLENTNKAFDAFGYVCQSIGNTFLLTKNE